MRAEVSGNGRVQEGSQRRALGPAFPREQSFSSLHCICTAQDQCLFGEVKVEGAQGQPDPA